MPLALQPPDDRPVQDGRRRAGGALHLAPVQPRSPRGRNHELDRTVGRLDQARAPYLDGLPGVLGVVGQAGEGHRSAASSSPTRRTVSPGATGLEAQKRCGAAHRSEGVSRSKQQTRRRAGIRHLRAAAHVAHAAGRSQVGQNTPGDLRAGQRGALQLDGQRRSRGGQLPVLERHDVDAHQRLLRSQLTERPDEGAAVRQADSGLHADCQALPVP